MEKNPTEDDLNNNRTWQATAPVHNARYLGVLLVFDKCMRPTAVEFNGEDCPLPTMCLSDTMLILFCSRIGLDFYPTSSSSTLSSLAASSSCPPCLFVAHTVVEHRIKNNLTFSWILQPPVLVSRSRLRSRRPALQVWSRSNVADSRSIYAPR